MPRKDKEEYNAYMKEYMRKKRASKRKKKEAGDMAKNADSDPEDFSAVTLEDVQKGISVAKQATKDKDTGEVDGVLEVLDKVAKFAPLAEKLIEGFTSAAKAWKPPAPQVVHPVQQGPVAPPGWNQMSGLQRLNMKYKNPEWYKQGEMYEAGVGPGNVHNVDPYYQVSQARGVEQSQGGEPRTLKELAAKHPDPPPVNEEVPMAKEQKPHKTIEDIKKEREANEATAKPAEPVEPAEPDNQESSVVEALQRDNARYVQMAVDFLKDMEMQTFKDYVANIDKLIETGKQMKALLPIHVRDMILNSPPDDIKRLFEEHCPDKYAWTEEQKLTEKLLEKYSEIQEELKKDNI